jgi:ribosomal protein L18
MPRLRVRRLPEGTYQLLLNLTNRHIHAQLVDREGGRVVVAVHSNQGVCRGFLLF